MALISLTTDFGSKDWFVGTMKGVILSIAPRTTIVDVCHDIGSGDVRAGALALAASYRFFPRGSIHVVIVDPGVGSSRKPIAVQTANYIFVGPDNGVLSSALAREKVKAIRHLTNQAFYLKPVSHTFHGRDVFSPVAAHLSRGVALEKLGPALKDFMSLDWPEPSIGFNRIEGEVIYIDRFGNGITNLTSSHLEQIKPARCTVVAKRNLVCPLKDFFQAVPSSSPVAVVGSSGLLEIAVNRGSAEKMLKLSIGTKVVLCAAGQQERKVRRAAGKL